jgi:phytoene synthase
MNRLHRDTFKAGSKTYFNSSLFFPSAVRRDVFALYGFVRVADDLVDRLPQDGEGFRRFVASYSRAARGQPAGDPIVDGFVELARRRGFDPAWTDAFLRSMQMDLGRASCDELEQTLRYVYGSAEVIGLFMARILDLPDAALPHARMLGRAMQFINFIRDLDEDRRLGRRYLPVAGTPLAGLVGPGGGIEPQIARRHPEAFRGFLRHHLALYRSWQAEAEAGYRYIPRRCRIAVKTAADMYLWTARRIDREPLVVFRRKVKPSRGRILLRVAANALGGARA